MTGRPLGSALRRKTRDEEACDGPGCDPSPWLTGTRKSAIQKQLGDVAQLGERSLRKAEAVGSIPIISTRDNQNAGLPVVGGLIFFVLPMFVVSS